MIGMCHFFPTVASNSKVLVIFPPVANPGFVVRQQSHQRKRYSGSELPKFNVPNNLQ